MIHLKNPKKKKEKQARTISTKEQSENQPHH